MPGPPRPESPRLRTHAGDPPHQRLLEALSRVQDPELGIHIIHLGLLYEADWDRDEAGTERLHIVLGTTSPACPMAGRIRDAAECELRAEFPELQRVTVQVDRTLRWTPQRISEAGLAELRELSPSGPREAVHNHLARPAWRRLPVLVIAMVTLVLGLSGGLARIGVSLPLPVDGLVVRHGPLMVLGFLGTLIAAERAVALDEGWAWLAPGFLALGAIGLWLDQSWIAFAGMQLGSLLLTAIATRIATMRPNHSMWTMAIGALAFTVSVMLYGLGAPIHSLVPWWTLFVVLTIAGERLEISTILQLRPGSLLCFRGSVVLLIAGTLTGLSDPDLGSHELGAGLLALAGWLFFQDISKQSLRRPGLSRFSAIALGTGYIWLAVAGGLWLRSGELRTGPVYDAALHSLFIGFIFSMIFAHAPLVFPAVLKVELPFHRWLYLPLVVLHGSIALRVAGDLGVDPGVTQVSAVASVGAILGYFALLQLGRFGPRISEVPLLALGFRPFFLGAGLYAMFGMGTWALFTQGEPVPGSNLLGSPVWWHAHGLVFGYSAAAIAGFLLTATRNWTGISTLRGPALASLITLWALARVLPFAGAPLWLVAATDLSFNLFLTAAIAVPLVQARRWRDAATFPSRLLTLTVANAIVYLGAAGYGPGQRFGVYLGLYVVLAVIFTIGKRVFPFFIERGLNKTVQVPRAPVLGRFNLVFFSAFVCVDLFWPMSPASAYLAGAIALVNGARLRHWVRRGVWSRPMLWILISGTGWLVAGFSMRALEPLGLFAPVLALHALTVGGIGLITLGMMARVSLGHTGRDIYASRPALTAGFGALVGASVVRVLGPLCQLPHVQCIAVSQVLWIVAFGLFIYIYAPILLRPRVDGKPG